MHSIPDRPSARLRPRGKLRCGSVVALACILAAAAATGSAASSITYSLTYVGPAEVAPHTIVTIEIRATFDTPLAASAFTISASGDAMAEVVARSASPFAPNGLSYISATSQIPFEPNLPHNLVAAPLREVLLDVNYDGIPGGATDGVPPGADILIETIDVEIVGPGDVAITLSDAQAAHTADSASGTSFSAVDVAGGASTVVISVQPSPLGDLNCDEVVSAGDIGPFVTALLDPSAYESQYSECDRLNGDIDENGELDGRDIDDFVRCLLP